MAYIDIIDSTGGDFRYLLQEDETVITIGSAEDCSISLPHITDLQPQHCTISLQQGCYVLTALPGASILAEGAPTDAVMLVPHAVYNLGSAMLMFNDAAPDAADATTPQEMVESVPEPVAEVAPEPVAEVVPEPVEEVAPASEAVEEAPVKKAKKKHKRPSADPLVATAFHTEEDGAIHVILRRLYVIAILALAFLAGLTMRYWMITGDYLIDELLK